jgi:diketogulonate reductase-like aldo/keto reductase
MYGTHRHLALSLAPYFTQGKLSRQDVFITSKIAHPGVPGNIIYLPDLHTCNGHMVIDIRKRVCEQFDKTLDDLGVGYLDLLLMHYPSAFDEKDESFARKNRLAIWRVFEELYHHKQVRAIGVSNFSIKHIQQLIEDGCKIIPMVNQIEFHPYCQNDTVVDYCRSKNILIQAYSPFGSGCIDIFNDPVLISIAAQYKGKTIGHIILRWIFQKGYVVIPKTTSEQRAKENLDIFDFQLSPQHIQEIDKLGQTQPTKRTCPDPNTML